MSRLVSPGYQKSALVNSILAPLEERIIQFKGLNRRSVVDEGEMRDMLNLTADNYPTLTPRKPRGRVLMPSDVKRTVQLISRYGKLGMVAIDTDGNIAFFYDGKRVPSVNDLSISTNAVVINTKLCFFPQKSYLEIVKEGDDINIGKYGYLEVSANNITAAVSISTDKTTITLPTQYDFKYDDAINIKGTLTYSSGSVDVEVSCVISEVDNKIIHIPANTFVELIPDGITDATFIGTIERTMPELDFVIEWNNRLWGASNNDNTIHACKLGDPTNWQYFQGTSLDSYYAQQGTDEEFTGVAGYSGHIIFFKPNNMTRIYGTAPSNYQVTNTQCYGVEEGSRRSVVTINDSVFYKSAIGIMAYDGGTPYCISDKFNAEFKNVSAGTEGEKYYASCIVRNGNTAKSELMVLDVDKAVWHKEDGTRIQSACTINNRLHIAYVDAEILVCDEDVFCDEYLMVGTEDVKAGIKIINPVRTPKNIPPEEDDMEDPLCIDNMKWMAEFGPFDEYIEEHKIYSKLALRFKANGPSSADIYIAIDEGAWEFVQHYDSISTQGEYVPIIPRRCDRYSIKIEGRGDCEIKSLTRRVRKGTFGRL